MKQNVLAAAVLLVALFFACDSGDKNSSENPAGNIQISSTPAGAAIYLDNVNTGNVTPFTINDLDTGSYEIRVSKSGYFDDSVVVRVEDGSTATPSFTLTLLSAPVGKIFLTSTPAGASIFLDGVNSAKITPDTLKNISSGEHTVKLTFAGYFDSTFTVTVPNANQTVSQSISLRALPVGNLFISSTPSGAAIFRNGTNTGKITPDTLKGLSPGNYTIKLTLTDYQDSTFTAAVTADQTVDYAITMRPVLKVPVVIQNIFNANCTRCHVGSSPPQNQNLTENLAYSNIVNVASNEQPALKRILPGNPDNSYLVRKIQGTPGISFSQMPADGPPFLSQADIDSIRSWVTNGALPR